MEEAITKAKRSMPNLDFDIRWRPFQLNAQAPEGKGVHKLDYYKKKFGEQRVAAMVPRMIETGKKHDINLVVKKGDDISIEDLNAEYVARRTRRGGCSAYCTLRK